MTTDKSHDIMRYDYQPLDFLFAPKSVALIGATENPNSVGRTLLWNLISNPFGGTVFPINPKRSNVLGIKAYASISQVPEKVDLAVIAIRAEFVPSVIQECVNAGVKGAIIISAGFKEIGDKGLELEKEILRIAKEGKMRIIGPNCLGLMCPPSGLNATFASAMAKSGPVGLISQSGAFCTSILDRSFQENIGFSAFISIGSMIDINWGDLIYYLGDDPNTRSIVIYMESIGNVKDFISAAREVALTKPIIVMKGGRTKEAAKAASSHTGALTSSDEVLACVFRRCGVLQVDRISEIFSMAELLSKSPRPKGKKLTIITNAGGPGVLATDALSWGKGELATLTDSTIEALNEFLPPHWSHSNPIDILGDATPERYAKTLKIAAEDTESDGLLVILTPQDMSDPTQTAEELKKVATEIKNKPILACWMGGSAIQAGTEILNRANIFTESYPDDAVRLFNLMWKYSRNLNLLYETPDLMFNDNKINHDNANKIINSVLASGRTLLTEFESKKVLQSYGIPTIATEIATNQEEAINLANQIGYPVVLKIHSYTITHKTDVGGVKLNLRSPEEVLNAFEEIKTGVNSEDFLGVTVQPMIKKDGYELILGSNIDPQFGPILLFGTGGELVEVFQDRSLALPPLNTTLAQRMMERTKIYEALKGVRGRKSVDLDALEEILVVFSQMVIEQKWIKEIDINPLIASADSLIALDARILLHDPALNVNQLPTSVIRPYPIKYISKSQLKNGTEVSIRPIRPEDEPLIFNFCQNLSEKTIYFRYFHLINMQSLISHERLTRICFIDYDREMALVAVKEDSSTQQNQLLAVARLSKLHGNNQEAELGMLVSDQFQHQGLGFELGSKLIKIGCEENLKCIIADILPENIPMQRLCQKLGFTLERNLDVIRAIYNYD